MSRLGLGSVQSICKPALVPFRSRCGACYDGTLTLTHGSLESTDNAALRLIARRICLDNNMVVCEWIMMMALSVIACFCDDSATFSLAGVCLSWRG